MDNGLYDRLSQQQLGFLSELLTLCF